MMMSENVKRYDLYETYGEYSMEGDACGNYVKYDDYDAQASAIAALKEQVAAARNDALEEAADICIRASNYDLSHEELAAAIRALASQPAAPTPVQQSVWDDALEEAALICDGVNNHDNPMTAGDCADEIRALKGQPAAPVAALNLPEGWGIAPLVMINDLYDDCERAVHKGYAWDGLEEIIQRIDDAYPAPASEVVAAPKQITQDHLSLIANLAAVVRVQNGNRHADTNSLLAHADRVLSVKPVAAEVPVQQPSDVLTKKEELELLCKIEDYMLITDHLGQTHQDCVAVENAIYAMVNGFIASRLAASGGALAVPEVEPVAWMRSNLLQCCTAKDKTKMENAGFGVWDEIAAEYTIPLFAAPAIPGADGGGK